MEYAELKKLSIDLEHFITPQWAIDAILDREILTHHVLDPATGTGVLAESAARRGHDVCAIDIHDWGYPKTQVFDFLELQDDLYSNIGEFSVLMNPPFSKATQFVEKAFAMGARKILMFQRWSFRESATRRPFFEKYPMARQYLCCARADCWRFDLPINEKGRRYDPEKENKELSTTPTAHGWFIYERGQEQSNPPTFNLYK